MSHENSKPHQTDKALDFLASFDEPRPPIEESEVKAVGEKFQNLVEDAILTHSDEVDYYPVESVNVLKLRIADREDPNVIWESTIHKFTDSKPEFENAEPAEQIGVSLTVKKYLDGKAKSGFTYRLGSDGVVRRADQEYREDSPEDSSFREAIKKSVYEGYFPFSLKEKTIREEIYTQEIEAGLGWDSLPDDPDYSERLAETLENEVNNLRLSRQMGYNDQPISLQEIDGLLSFIAQPDFEVVSD